MGLGLGLGGVLAIKEGYEEGRAAHLVSDDEGGFVRAPAHEREGLHLKEVRVARSHLASVRVRVEGEGEGEGGG